MAFIKRKIDVELSLNGDTFDGSNNVVRLTGLRISALIHEFLGGVGNWANDATLRISGMKNADMAHLSTLGFIAANYNSPSGKMNNIKVYAGDDDAGMSLVFSGGITSGNVNYNAQPDVGVDLVCSALADLQFQRVAPSSYKGAMDVATMLQAICDAATPPIGFVNNGVTSKLVNHAVGGSPKHQIEDICLAAGIFSKFTNGTSGRMLTIWPPRRKCRQYDHQCRPRYWHGWLPTVFSAWHKHQLPVQSAHRGWPTNKRHQLNACTCRECTPSGSRHTAWARSAAHIRSQWHVPGDCSNARPCIGNTWWPLVHACRDDILAVLRALMRSDVVSKRGFKHSKKLIG
jgi:hypothetical protein